VQPAVHEPEKWNIFHVVLSHKHRIVFVQGGRWDIQVRAMVRAKNVLPFRIELFFIDNFKWYADEDKQTLCPPSVEDSYELKFFPKNNRDQQEKEKDDKKEKEYDNTVTSIEAPDKFHALGGSTYSYGMDMPTQSLHVVPSLFRA